MVNHHGFSKAGFEKIKDFNKNAADPNVPNVKFTLADNPQRASELGKIGGKMNKGKKDTQLTKDRKSLSQQVRWISIAIANGQVPKDGSVDNVLKRIRSGVAISGTVQTMLDDMLDSLDEFEDPRDKFQAKEKIVKIYMDVLKLHHATEENVKKKVPLEQLNAMMKERQEQRKSE